MIANARTPRSYLCNTSQYYYQIYIEPGKEATYCSPHKSSGGMLLLSPTPVMVLAQDCNCYLEQQEQTASNEP